MADENSGAGEDENSVTAATDAPSRQQTGALADLKDMVEGAAAGGDDVAPPLAAFGAVGGGPLPHAFLHYIMYI